MDHYLLRIFYFNLCHAVCAVPYRGLYRSASLIVNLERYSMNPLNEVLPDLDMSKDDRVRVFRRTIHGLQAYEGMEVDAYIVITDRYLLILDTMLCPEDVAAMIQSVSAELSGHSLLCIDS